MTTFSRNVIGLGALLVAQWGCAASITVNTATDDFGSVPTNCSLREAIQSANDNADFGGCTSTGVYGDAVTDVINLPTLGAGSAFTLTRIGTDDSNVAGDLDIDGLVRISGVSTANSVIRGDTNDADSDRNRLIHVISGTATLNDLTLRDGLENNQVAGGGLRTEPGTVTVLNRVHVVDNFADGNAGGILNRGELTLNQSIVQGNETRNSATGGGGIFSSPDTTLTLNDSQVRNNIAKSQTSEVLGGGIHGASGATLLIDNCVIDGNLADGRNSGNPLQAAWGGGVFALGTLTVIQSSITNNEAIGLGSGGGGIATRSHTSVLIDRSVISLNRAAGLISPESVPSLGGGLAVEGALLGTPAVVRDTLISSNLVESTDSGSGGGAYGFLQLTRTTLAFNIASGDGSSHGGGFLPRFASSLVNSTLIGNQAQGNGGGIYMDSVASVLKVRSSTIVDNTSNAQGGGIAVNSGSVDLANSLLAGNQAVTGGLNCVGTLDTLGHNLVETITGCGFTAGPTDMIQLSPFLAEISSDDGPLVGSSLGLPTRMPIFAALPGSPVLDNGDPQGCVDDEGIDLETDQIGRPRALDAAQRDEAARCDIGAVENLDSLFIDGFDG